MAEETKKMSLIPGNREWMNQSDILMGIGVIAIVVMLVIPLPTFLLDLLMAISIMIGLLTLMVVMFVHRSFDFSVFPSLLLVSTVFRLALNVSSKPEELTDIIQRREGVKVTERSFKPKHMR